MSKSNSVDVQGLTENKKKMFLVTHISKVNQEKLEDIHLYGDRDVRFFAYCICCGELYIEKWYKTKENVWKKAYSDSVGIKIKEKNGVEYTEWRYHTHGLFYEPFNIYANEIEDDELKMIILKNRL